MPQVLIGAFAAVAAIIVHFASSGQMNAGVAAMAGIVALIVLVLGLRATR
jgi:hypothetical protein